MSEIGTLAVRALAGGLLVAAFAVLGEILVPKRFAGIMSAAPSVAIANLLLIILTKGRHYGLLESQGMIVGASAFLAATLIGRPLVRRYGALKGSLGLCGAWLGIALAGYLAVLR